LIEGEWVLTLYRRRGLPRAYPTRIESTLTAFANTGPSVFAATVWVVTSAGFLGVIVRRFALRRLHPSWFECGLRVADGQVVGLKTRWRNGIGWFENEAFIWTRIPIPSRPLTLALVPSENAARSAKVRELWGIAPDCTVVQAIIEGGTLEVALLPRDVARFEEMLLRG